MAMMPRLTITQGHALEKLRELPSEFVHCIISSPPYWGLRNYKLPPTIWGGIDGCEHDWIDASYRIRSNDNKGNTGNEKQYTNVGTLGRDKPVENDFCSKCNAWRGSLGLEPTPELYVEHLVSVLREAKRVLRSDGTLWLNISSSYASSGQVENALACGNDDKVPLDSRRSDSGYSDLCDECRDAALSRNADICRPRSAKDDASLLKACRDVPSDSSTKPQGVSPRGAPASTTRSSFRRDRAACVPAAKALDGQPKWTSSFDGGSLSGHRSAYTSDTALNAHPSGVGMLGITFSCKACGNLAIKPLRFKPKDMVPIPFMLAMALQADGWYLRSDVIWSKLNPMPESVSDRPSKSHEYIFLLSKSANYFFDMEAIKEPVSGTAHKRQALDGSPPSLAFKMQASGMRNRNNPSFQSYMKDLDPELSRNKRSVWTIATAPYPEAHFATYPPDLIKPCILAGTSAKGCCAKCGAPWERVVESMPMEIDRSFNHPLELRTRTSGTMTKPPETKTLGWQPTCKCWSGNDGVFNTVPCTVLDCFAGSGTTGQVALELGRNAILIELNERYADLCRQRCNVTPGLPLFA